MTLPILVSLPHAGLRIPDEIATLVSLDASAIVQDGDEQALDIYGPLKATAAAFVTTDIARAAVDLNRAEDDRRPDGVIKTHTCFNIPVYKQPPSEQLVRQLLNSYYHPYHRHLSEIAARGDVRLGIDCHTMVAVAPPIASDAGTLRPAVCLGNLDGKSCPTEWIEKLAPILASKIGQPVALNQPFKGGFITRSHSSEMPWIQIEISRGDFASVDEKSRAVRDALEEWVPSL